MRGRKVIGEGGKGRNVFWGGRGKGRKGSERGEKCEERKVIGEEEREEKCYGKEERGIKYEGEEGNRGRGKGEK